MSIRKLCQRAAVAVLTIAPALAGASQLPVQQVQLEVERFELPNGLRVILAPDSNAAMASVHVWYGVGSRDEPPGRMGFAHFFEHVMFTGSQHAPAGTHERLIRGAGGWSNGFTNHDATGYFQVVLRNHLERVLWLEADRMGFLLPTLDSARFLAQREVVKNERRDIVDSPYGRVNEIMLWALYPPPHPHGWFPAGYMPDLEAATLEDIREFHRTWYGPANATLAIAGGFDSDSTRTAILRWFGDLSGSDPPARQPVPPSPLRVERRLVFEDRVTSPRLVVYWPTVGLGADDDAALAYLAAVLTQTGYSRLSRRLVQERGLATRVTATQLGFEHLGEFRVTVEPATGQSLVDVLAAMDSVLAVMLENGPTEDEVETVRVTLMTNWVAGLEHVEGRASRLIQGTVQARRPDHYAHYLARLRGMTASSIRDAARSYLGSQRVVLSVVPADRLDLAAHTTSRELVRIAADGKGYHFVEGR